MRKILLAGLVSALMVTPVHSRAQEACPPDHEKPRRIAERFAIEPLLAPALEVAGLEGLRSEEIQVISKKEDADVCRQLKAWADSKFDPERRESALRWTFYRARDRFIVVRWLPAQSQNASISMMRTDGAWILDEDMNELTSAAM